MRKFLIAFFVAYILLGTVASLQSVTAQVQSFTFSGNSKESYQCFDENGRSVEPLDERDRQGYWVCPCNDGVAYNAATGLCGTDSLCDVSNPDNPERFGDNGCPPVRSTLKPPTLQQLEIWFVRILYAIWALVGALSFFFLVALGYQYMITRGDVTKITEIRQKIIYYIIGFVLVFLAVPILTTVFRLLGINQDVDCYNVSMPGFQFFFTDLCTDPLNRIEEGLLADPCSVENPDGRVCAPNVDHNRIYRCTRTVNGSLATIAYACPDEVWERAVNTGPVIDE